MHQKHNWEQPNWAVKTSSNSCSKKQQQQTRGVVEEPAKRAFSWEKPDWAVPEKHVSDKRIDKRSIESPVLKKSEGAVKRTECRGKEGSSTEVVTVDDEDEISGLQLRLQKAKEMKAKLTKMCGNVKKDEQAVSDAAKSKEEKKDRVVGSMTVEQETKLEMARRIAKEREEAAWRARQAERNEADRKKREEARAKILQKAS
jgi:hypothetical protein